MLLKMDSPLSVADKTQLICDGVEYDANEEETISP